MLVPVVMPLTHPLLAHFLGDYEPERAAPNLLALDRITLGAATTGTVLLPGDGGPVMGRAWLRALRTLIGPFPTVVTPAAISAGEGWWEALSRRHFG